MISDQVMDNFSQARKTYDRYATLQGDVARDLAARLKGLDIPPGEILEIGCGTGLFTEQLCRLFPDRWLTISDLSPSMLSAAWQRLYLDLADRARFRLLDGQQVTPDVPYALITASLVFQWYEEITTGLFRAYRALKPGGWLVAAVPVEGSFPEWRAAAAGAGVPFTANPLPTHLSGEVRRYVYSYPSPFEFFRSLKGIGAHTQVQQQRLTASQLRRLCNAWERPVQSTYHILFLKVHKPCIS